MSREDSEGELHTTDAVKVICRVRPFSRREIDIHLETHSAEEPIRPIISMEGKDTIFLDPETFAERERFAFDVSLWSVSPESSTDTAKFASQETVMETVGLPAISQVWSGYNTSVFAYGQTGSGKTYTMMGGEEEPGLIPRMCQELFRSLERRRREESGKIVEGTMKEYRLEARFLEIYNDKVKDLLWELRNPAESFEGIDHENLKVRHIPNMGPLIVGLTSVTVDCWEDCLRLIEEGTRHRSVAATKMNATSSRSHSIFRLNFVQTTRILATRVYEKPKSFDKISNVSLVDLAGSERNKKTGAQGDRLKEAVAINKSLTALKNVIDALVEGRQVIPFRDSQLTFLLSESLGGNSKTFMISCVSPHSDNADETLNTLRYALRAQGIVCHATVNESEELRKMNQMRQELEQLRQLKEEPHDQLTQELRRAQEGKREQLASMQSVSAQQQELQQELQRNVDMSNELKKNSKFQMAFRVILARRVEKACQRWLLEQRTEIDALRSKLKESDRQLQVATAHRTGALKSENDAKTLYKAREKELDALRARNSALEWRKRTLMKQDEQLRLAAERKMNMKPTVSLVTKFLSAFHQLKFQQKLCTAIENGEEDLKKAQDAVNATEKNQREKQAQLIKDASDELQRLQSELNSGKNKLQESQTSLSNKVQGLHAECIFLETEIKETTEHHEKSIAATNKTKAAFFFSSKEEWTTKLQKHSLDKQIQFSSLSDAAEHELSRLATQHEEEIEKLRRDSQAVLERVVQSSMHATEQLSACQQLEDERIEALNRESNIFLTAHRQSEQRYRHYYEDLMTAMKAHSSANDDCSLVLRLLFDIKSKSIVLRELSEMLSTRTHIDDKRLEAVPAVLQPQHDTPIGPKRKVFAAALSQPRSRSPAISKRIGL